MALDAAEFISELDVDSPAGTDPINQGDDQIRTVKKATQQSLPLLDAAVNITSAQMNQMAIKNEANTFTQQNTFQQQATFNNTVLITPTAGLVLDSGGTAQQSFDKSGVRRWQFSVADVSGDWDLRRFVGGVLQDAPLIFALASGEATFLKNTNFTGRLLTADGVESAPAYSFTSDPSTGFFFSGGNNINTVIGGVTVFAMSTNGMFAGPGFKMHVDGDLAANDPGWTFSNDPDTGMFRVSANVLGFSTAGVNRFQINADGRPLFNSSNAMELRTPATSTAASYQLKPGGILFFEMASGTVSNAVWSLVRYSNGGGFLGLPLQVERLTGTVLMPELSTSNPGGSGRLWKNGNVVNIT